MTIEERLTRLEETAGRLEGVVEKLATNVTAFIVSATESNVDLARRILERKRALFVMSGAC